MTRFRCKIRFHQLNDKCICVSCGVTLHDWKSIIRRKIISSKTVSSRGPAYERWIGEEHELDVWTEKTCRRCHVFIETIPERHYVDSETGKFTDLEVKKDDLNIAGFLFLVPVVIVIVMVLIKLIEKI